MSGRGDRGHFELRRACSAVTQANPPHPSEFIELGGTVCIKPTFHDAGPLHCERGIGRVDGPPPYP